MKSPKARRKTTAEKQLIIAKSKCFISKNPYATYKDMESEFGVNRHTLRMWILDPELNDAPADKRTALEAKEDSLFLDVAFKIAGAFKTTNCIKEYNNSLKKDG